jgi:outer membrane protein TolC
MYSVSAGLSVQWDIGGAAAAGERAARMRRARSDEERASAESELAVAALTATHRLADARARIEIASVAADVAVETLRIEVAAFQAGRSTNMAVFQREDDVASAKLRLARARIDAIEADLDVAYLTGDLLHRFGLRVTRKNP